LPEPLADLDRIWEEETGPNPEPLPEASFPEKITDNQAVRIAYREEMDNIAGYLRHAQHQMVQNFTKVFFGHIKRLAQQK
jgi:hypothetical protein